MPDRTAYPSPPKIVVFEGVDGAGKSSLAGALARYYDRQFPKLRLASGSFPGTAPSTLGEWVYRLHHAETDCMALKSLSPGALQLLHVAAHVDGIHSWIGPALKSGHVILDRYWWSTYAYARLSYGVDEAWALVSAELPFWKPLPDLIVIYVTRSVSLKSAELNPRQHNRLSRYYGEVVVRERELGTVVHELSNDGEFEETWCNLLRCLELPNTPVPEQRIPWTNE